jgi:hypothetical protein
MTLFHLRFVLLVAACSLLYPESKAADKVDPISGVWSWDASGRPGGIRKSEMKLWKEGESLKGSLHVGGRELPIKNAKVDGNRLTFDVEVAFNGVSHKTTYSGVVKDGTIKGNIQPDPNPNGQTRIRDWDAKRERSLWVCTTHNPRHTATDAQEMAKLSREMGCVWDR